MGRKRKEGRLERGKGERGLDIDPLTLCQQFTPL